jgi:HK97 family phage major capsid protein
MPAETRPRLPQNAQQLVDTFRDTDRMAEILANPAALNAFTADYAKAFADKDPNFQAKVDEQRQRTMAQMLRESGGRTPVDMRAGTARDALYGPKALGTIMDGTEWADPARLLVAIHPALGSDADRQALRALTGPAIKNAFGSTVPSEGGFLIPETLRSQIIELALERAIVRPRAQVIPMSTLRVPIPLVDETSHASSLAGGLVAFWTEEGAALVPSDAKFGRVVLDAKKLSIFANVPNELLADAIALAAWLPRAFGRTATWYEDVAFLTGTGVGEPGGVLNATGRVDVTRAVGAPAIEFDDVLNMYVRMLPDSLTEAVWVANIDTFPALSKLFFEPVAGQPAVPVLWLNNGQVIGAPPQTLMGRPVIFTEKVPSVASAGSLSFLDLSYYLIGDRQAATIQTSEHYRFQNDETSYRLIERVDGRPAISSPLTPANGTNTLSPYVRLV